MADQSRPSDELELEPWYRDGNDDIVEPDRVTLQTQYFWTHWLRILGAGPAVVLIRLRMHCYFNKLTGENRNTCWPGILTLADELGVERKAIMRYLARLEFFDFIRRKKRTRWSDVHRRPVRTTDKYRVKMWDPVAPEHEGQVFLGEVQRLVEGVAEHAEDQGISEESQKGTYGLPTVQKSHKRTYDAVPKRDHRKKYLEEVLNNVNVATPVKERLIRTSDLADQMLEQLGDRHSMGFYRKVAQTMPEHLVHRALSETKEAKHGGQVVNAGAYFTARIRQIAKEQGIKL